MPSTVNASARRQRRNQLLSKRLRECFLQNRPHLDSKHQTRFCSCAWMHNVNTQRVPSASLSGRSIFIQIQRERPRLGCDGLQTPPRRRGRDALPAFVTVRTLTANACINTLTHACTHTHTYAKRQWHQVLIVQPTETKEWKKSEKWPWLCPCHRLGG